MANYAKIRTKPNAKVKITQKGATHNLVVAKAPRNTETNLPKYKVAAKVPRNTRIRIKKS